jgi:glycosyltransferase involved in cell wall biosynthesis
MIELSIVSAIYNDANTVKQLVSEFQKELLKLGISFEIILINDGSVDNSEEEIRKVCEKNSFIKGISLSRNFGQQIAISSGISFAKGRYVLLIDGDLENPIDSISDLYYKIIEGYDIVYAVSPIRQSLSKKITSKLFWFVICKLLKINIVKDQLLLRIMSRKVVDAYNMYPEVSRSVAGINHDIGMKSSSIIVTPRKRIYGKSNYNFSKRLNMFIDIFLNMSARPLNLVIFFGLFALILSLILTVIYFIKYYTGGTIIGNTSIMVSILFFGGAILFILGIMARYLSLIYTEVKRRPLFLVKEKYNL